jgi:hypothetical protein
VFARDGSMIHGELRIEHSTTCANRVVDTELPPLGTGSVIGWEVSGGDLWLTGAEGLLPRWVGAWMALLDGSGSELGAFEVLATDGGGRALLAGAAGVSGVSSYRGEYRFDRMEVLGGAGLVARDRVELGAAEFTGAARLSGEVVSDDLTVRSGAVLSAAEGDTLRLEVPGTLTIEVDGKVDMTGRGYPGGVSSSAVGGAPPWVLGSVSDAGGSHGGAGTWWDVANSSGEVYDSVVRPVLSGGGGSLDNDGSGNGQSGGGVVEIMAGWVVLDGEVLAGGVTNDNGSRAGGAGGTVWIEAGVLSGSGTISANGGWIKTNTTSTRVGSGGGGRVALEVGSFVGFDPSVQATAAGAPRYDGLWAVQGCSAPGTVFARDGSMIHGELRIEHSTACANRVVDTELPPLGSGSIAGWEPSAGDAWMTAAEALHPRWVGAWVVPVDAGGVELGSFKVLAIDAAGRALLDGADLVVGATSYRGEYRFDRVDVLGGAGLIARDAVWVDEMEIGGAARLSGPVVATEMSVLAGAVLVPAEGDTLRLEAPGTLTVEAGASLDVSGRGYAGGVSGAPAGGAPVNVLGSLSDAGGSHGGAGLAWDTAATTAGEVYDSVTGPRLPGGGGALDNDGSGTGTGGGGVIDVVAGSVVLNGQILALGAHNDNGSRPAGAGGTVRITADLLSGTGVVNANGGFSRSSTASKNAGAGGGGRVLLDVASLSGFDPATQVSAFGNARYNGLWTLLACAAPGTIYHRSASSSHGDLYVAHWSDCTGKPSRNTVLPAVGSGVVGAADPDAETPADLWIEPQDPNTLFDLGVVGMTVRIDGADYLVVDQSSDRRRLLLQGAAGAVDLGDAYQGIYEFDTVIVRNGAVLEFLDPAEVGTFDVDGNSQVIQP